MRFPGFSRRRFVALSLTAAMALPLADAVAAPFTSNRITVRIEGSGPDVILIPGFNSSPRTWASTVAAMPGYRYYLVQDVLSRLMVVDMPPNIGALFAPPGASKEQVRAIADRIGAGMANNTPEQRKASAAATIDSMVNNVAMRPVGVEDSVTSDPVMASHVYPELLTTDMGPELARITVPLTVLYVQPKSVPIPEAQFDAAYKGWYAAVPHVTLKRIADSAHFIMWDQPARFQAALKAFLDGLDGVPNPST